MGIVDALGEGFRLVFRRPTLLAIPVLVDILLQMLPPLSIRDLLLRSFGSNEAMSGLPPVALSPLLTFFIPSTVGFASGGKLVDSKAVELGGVGSAVAIAAVFTVVGMVIAAAYLGAVAGAVRSRALGPGMLDYVVSRFPRLMGLTLAVLGAMGVSIALLMLVMGFVPILGQLLVLIVAAAFFSALFVLFFAVVALMVEDVSIRGSIECSLELLKAHAGPATLFIVVSTLINVGLSVIWITLLSSAPGLIVAVVANALVGTAIAAGSMLFYLSRMHEDEFRDMTPDSGA